MSGQRFVLPQDLMLLSRGAVPLGADRALAQVAASVLGDEAMHRAVLRQALGENPVPSAFMS